MLTPPNSRLCVVTPVGNEADTIAQFLEAVQVHLGPQDRHLLIIDGFSKDDTRAIVKSYIGSGQGSHVELIEASENRCIRDAYVRGYREAVARGAEWVLEIDAGFSHDPACIPSFLEKMEQGYDYAGGSRFMKGAEYHGGPFRRLLSQGGTLAAKLLLRCRLTDMTSGFQCYTRDTLEYVLAKGIESRGGFFQTEIRYWVSFRKWSEIPIVYGNTKATVPAKYVFDGITGLLKLVKRSLSVSKSATAGV